MVDDLASRLRAEELAAARRHADGQARKSAGFVAALDLGRRDVEKDGEQIIAQVRKGLNHHPNSMDRLTL